MSEDKIFADGFLFKRNEKAPDFVVGSLSVKIDDAVAFMRKHEKQGWVNLSVKQARSGNYYIELDTFSPKKKDDGNESSAPSKKEEDDGDDLPF